MGFEHPWLLLLIPLALAPLAARWLRELPAGAVGHSAQRAMHTWRTRLLWLPSALAALGLACTALAGASPWLEARPLPDRSQARSIMIAVDASESMRAVDYELDGRRASRMEIALRFASEFIEGRRGDRVGIVVFGGQAATQCPLTYDRAVAARLLSYVEPEVLGARTALGEGLALAVARLGGGGAVVLLSDGENTAGQTQPAEAARAAAGRGVRVYAVGIGSGGAAPVPVRLPSGRTCLAMKDYRLDAESLEQIATVSGGQFLRAQDADALRTVFAEIDELEPSAAGAPRAVPTRPAGVSFGLAGLLLVSAALTLSATVLRAAPFLR